MQYTAAILAAMATVASAQMKNMTTPATGTARSMATPAAAPAPMSGMPMPAAAPAPMPGMPMPAAAPAPMPAAGGSMGMEMGMGMSMGMGMGGAMSMMNMTGLSAQCQQIARLTGFTKFAANDTQVQMAAQMIPLTPEQVTELKANATMANTQLMELESNATLSMTCAQVNEVTVPCQQYAGLMKLEEISQNDTQLMMLQQSRNLSDAQITSLKAFAATQVDNLDMMNNNITLVTQCMDLQANMMAGMPQADAALKAHATALPADATNAAGTMTETTGDMNTANNETMKSKSASSAVTMSSFLVGAGVGVSVVLLA